MKTIITIVISFVIIGLGHSQSISHYPEPLIVNCENVTKEVELLSSFKVDFIPLETCNNSFIKRIQKIIPVKEHFIIWDKKIKTIFVFGKDGSFQKKISSVNKPGPGEFLYCYDVYSNDTTIFILSYKMIFMYDMEFNFLKKVRLNKAYEKFIIDNNWVYLYNNNQTPVDREKAGVMNLSNPDEAHPILFEERQLGMFHVDNPFHFCINKDEVLFCYPFTDTIYSLQKTNVYPKYKLTFKGRKFPAHAFDNIPDNPMASMTMRNALLKKKFAFWPTNFVENSLGTYLWFSLDGKIVRFFRAASNSKQFLTEKFILDGIPINFILRGFSQNSLIISVNPWDLSDNIKSKLNSQGYEIKDDANPILVILSTLRKNHSYSIDLTP